MEKKKKIASDLKASETKQRNLSNAFESLQSQASDLLVFSIQWKDLQEHFDSTRKAMQTLLEDLHNRENVLEAKELTFKCEMDAKTDELLGVQKLVDEKVKEAIELKREAGVVEKRVQERTKKLNWVERRIEEKANEAEIKEKEVRKLREDVKMKGERLEELERRVKAREEKLRWVEKSLEDMAKMAGSKEEEVRVIQGSLNVCRESIKSKEGELDAIVGLIEGKKKEVEVKEERIRTLQGLIQGFEKEVKSKEESSMVKAKEYGMEEWSCKLELKERVVELKEKRLESMTEEVKKWVEELDSLSTELKVKEGKLQQEAEELELAKKTQESNAALLFSVNDESDMNFTDGRNLLLYMYEHMKRNESMSKRISSFLQQVSSEPGKLVLDAMQGFYPSNLSVENDECDLVLVRRACLLLLDELKGASPQISPEMREEAVKLATDWKTKMKVGSENWMESLGFLCLVNTYGMSSVFDPKELQSLLDVVYQHAQGMELSRGLGFTDKAPDYSEICSTVKTESPESLVAKNEAASSNVQETATTSAETHLQGLQNEKSRCVIHDLIKRKRLIGAAGLIYTLKFSDEFSAVQVLKEFVDNVNKRHRTRNTKKKFLEGKDKITELYIADLQVALLCIRAYNLESEYPLEEIESQVAQLERSKEQRQMSLKKFEFQKQKPWKSPKAKRQQTAAQISFNVEQQEEQKTSKTKLHEEPKASIKVGSQREDEHQKTCDATLQAKVEQIASDIVEEQQQQQQQQQQLHQQERTTFNITQQEQPKQKKGKKRSNKFDHQHQPQNKYRKTSVVPDRPFRSHPDHPNSPHSSPSAWPHQKSGHHLHSNTAFNNNQIHGNSVHPMQVGNVVNHAANYGYGGHNPVLNHAYPYLPRPPSH